MFGKEPFRNFLKKLRLKLFLCKSVLHRFFKWLFVTHKNWWLWERIWGAFNRYQGLENDVHMNLIKNNFLFPLLFCFVFFVLFSVVYLVFLHEKLMKYKKQYTTNNNNAKNQTNAFLIHMIISRLGADISFC